MTDGTVPRVCRRCVLPATFPRISFDAEGICVYCRRREASAGEGPKERRRYAARFSRLVGDLLSPEQRQGRSHDVLAAYSGGKDSSYTLMLLKEKYGLRVLAFTFDNGFISPRATENMRRVTEELGIDHLTFKPDWTVLRKVFREAAAGEIFGPKTLERASTICTACMALVKSVTLRTAIGRRIPLVAYGWSPGQAPLRSCLVRQNPSFVRAAQRSLLGPLSEAAGEGVLAYTLGEEELSRKDLFPYDVHPLAWEEYDEQRIIAAISRLGWAAPGDTDSNSTNCLLNSLGIEIHLRRHGFHPYAWEVANLVREGMLPREAGFDRIYGQAAASSADAVKERLGEMAGSGDGPPAATEVF